MKTFLIPSAGKATRLYPLSENLPKILIDINGIPIFHYLYENAVKYKCDNIVVIINSEFKDLFNKFIKANYRNSKLPIHIVVDGNPIGVASSVAVGLRSSNCNDNVILNLSDTLITNSDELISNESNFICYFKEYQEVGNDWFKRWCFVNLENDKVIGFQDKPSIEPAEPNEVVGLYGFNRDEFLKYSKDLINENSKEVQLSHVFNKFDSVLNGIEIKNRDNWIDTGTLENLNKARMNLFISRSHNRIWQSDSNIFKTSTDIKKLRDEFVWYTINKDKYYGSKDVTFSTKFDNAMITLPKYNMDNLGSQFLFKFNTESLFTESIKLIFENFINNNAIVNIEDDGSNYDTFFVKTKTRVDEFVSNNELYSDVMMEYRLILKEFNYLIDFFDDLKVVADKFHSSRIHGDLNLSNILFCPKFLTFKLIDPRGSYGKHIDIGDIRYDLAKLLHSTEGKYEALIYGLYEIVDGKLVYFMSKDKESLFEKATEEIFKQSSKIGICEEELRLIEASLFLSMLPLHKESLKRQLAILLTFKNILRLIYA